MKFTNTRIMNFEGAFRGLRNPLESWDKSDSAFGIGDINYIDDDYAIADCYCRKENLPYGELYDKKMNEYGDWLRVNGIIGAGNYTIEYAFIGPNDLDLAKRMIKAGSSDRKFLRQIFVSVDITAPLYWWKEFDTYKVATVANSTSTMHKLASTPITKECFEMDDYCADLEIYTAQESKTDQNPSLVVDWLWNQMINHCENLRVLYNKTKDKRYWKELIRILPEGWLQTRTVTLNYEILRNIFAQRRNHRLTEWHQFCDWLKSLPYGQELITYGIE